jgi:hypothetical protein
MIVDNFKLTGKLKIEVNNEVVAEVPNIVVTDGKEYVASRMKDASTTAMTHMSVGTGSTAAAASDSALGSQISGSRTALTSTNVTGNDIVYVATFGPGTGTGAITEAGIFNASSSGTMLCRTVFSVVNKGSADSMTITWTVTVS